MTIYAAISFFSTIVLLVFGVAVLAANRKQTINRAFFVFSLSMACYIFAEFMMRSVSHDEQANFWVLFGGGVYVATAAFFHVVLEFTRKGAILRNRRNLIIFYAVPSAVWFHDFFSTSLTGLPKKCAWGYTFTAGTDPVLYGISIVWLLSYSFVALYLMIHYYLTVGDALKERQVRLVLYGCTLSFIAGVIEIAAQSFNINLMGTTSIGLVVMSGFLGYAIQRYELFELNTSSAADNIIELMPDALFIMDINGKLLSTNRALLEMLGYSNEDLTDTNANAIFSDPKFRDRIIVRILGNTPLLNHETQYRTKEGKDIYVSFSSSGIRNKIGSLEGIVGIATDITVRKRWEEELHNIAVRDQLTGLYNRRGFMALAEQQLKLAQRTKEGFYIFFIDLDGLKRINDSLGHNEGDAAIVEVGQVLKETFRESDIIARMGGDEFAVIVVNMKTDNPQGIMHRLNEIQEAHNTRKERKFPLSFSAGRIYCDPAAAVSLNDLLKSADNLMYEQKRKKKQALP